ncbi:hypothetical protein K2P47_04205 [Patescibacteria group bacterium]|nr:hypothetical protein [Patescibacteria group bacterium]
MKKVLLVLFLATASTGASAETLIHPDGGWSFETSQACKAGYYHFNGVRYEVGRYKGKLVIGEAIFDVKCGPKSSGGGGGGGGGGGFSHGGETLSESQTRSGETNPGETQGQESQQGTSDDGSDAGFGAFSG